MRGLGWVRLSRVPRTGAERLKLVQEPQNVLAFLIQALLLKDEQLELKEMN